MFITCGLSQNVPYKDSKGTVQLCTLRPGRHNYPMLDPKDPLLAETLRVLRKIRKITFDDLLPGDNEILVSAPEGVDPVDYLASKVIHQGSPVGKHVNEKSAERIAKEAKASKEKGKNVHIGGNTGNAPSGGGPAPGSDSGKKPRGVPDKE